METFDLAVIGGGFTGAAAAIQAARDGLSVILCEATNALGGAASLNLVNPFMPYCTERDGKRLVLSAGLFTEITENIIALSDEIEGKTKYAHLPMSTFNEEYVKIVLNRMCLSAGVKLLFHARLTDVEAEGGKVNAVTLATRSGNLRLAARYFIDATGDAELTYKAGFSTRLGRDEDHLCQPMTLCFRVANVDKEKFAAARRTVQEKYKELRAAGKIKNIREDVLWFPTTVDSIIHFNTTRIVKRDPTNAFDVTAAECEAREQVLEFIKFLREYAPGCENAVLISTALSIGARESRMIDGEYLLTKEDLLAFRKFDDGIAACNYDIDIHNPEGSGTSHYYFPKGEYYTIPYRCLVPKGSVNLLVAGRCISCTHEAQASCRCIPTVTTLGQAAGAAAAVAAKSGTTVSDADVKTIRANLTAAGAFF